MKKKTSKQILTEAYEVIKAKQDSSHEAVDPILLGAMEEYKNQSEWISCKAALPEDGISVLMFTENYVFMGYYHLGNWSHECSGNICSVTHWQTLPEIPKE